MQPPPAPAVPKAGAGSGHRVKAQASQRALAANALLPEDGTGRERQSLQHPAVLESLDVL